MDKIAEMLTKIRNAQMAEHKEVVVEYSKFKLALAKILLKEGFVESISNNNDQDKIVISLGYNQDLRSKKEPRIRGIRKVSKLGQRIYVKSKDIKSVKNKYGIGVFSTSQGIVTGEEARKMGLGGEYICEIW